MREFVACLSGFGYDITILAEQAGARGSRDGSFRYFDLPGRAEKTSDNPAAESGDERSRQAELARFELNSSMETFIQNLQARSKFDLVYERYSLFSLAGQRLAKSRGLPFVLEVNAPLMEEAARYRRLIRKDLAELVEKTLFSEASHIIAVSDEVAEYIVRAAPKAAVTVVPNGVRVDKFIDSQAGETPETLRSTFNDKDFVVCFVGSLKPWHGVDILIDSFAGLPADGKPNGLLIVGGKGDLKNQLKQTCRERGLKNRVKFTGSVEHDDIPALLGRADVLVAPYPDLNDFYFSALKIFEYMAAGKAIVASAIGQIEKILTHEHNALLTPPGDVNALRDALTRLKNDAALRKRLGENARKEAREKHTWKHRMITVDAIFRDLIEAGQTRIEEKP